MTAEDKFCPRCGEVTGVTGASQVIQAGQVVAAQVQRPQPVLRYASLGDRFVAQVIDWMILIVADAVIFGLIGLTAWMTNPLGLLAFDAATFYWGIIGAVIPLLYFAYFESTTGQTIGKSLVSIRVVDQTSGGRVDLLSAFIRNIARIADFLPVFYILGAIAIESSARKQRIGDMVANTLVVKVQK